MIILDYNFFLFLLDYNPVFIYLVYCFSFCFRWLMCWFCLFSTPLTLTKVDVGQRECWRLKCVAASFTKHYWIRLLGTTHRSALFFGYSGHLGQTVKCFNDICVYFGLFFILLRLLLNFLYHCICAGRYFLHEFLYVAFVWYNYVYVYVFYRCYSIWFCVLYRWCAGIFPASFPWHRGCCVLPTAV